MTLQKQIQELQKQLQLRYPPKLWAFMQEETNVLVKSHIVKQSLKEGSKAPSFELLNALGEVVKSSDLLSRGSLVVTFYHGEWCPYCNLTLQAYQSILPELKDLRAFLVAISPQILSRTYSTMEKNRLTFEVLSDVGNRVARDYGLVFTLNEALRPLYQAIGFNIPIFNGDESWELPVTSTFIITQDSIVKLAFIGMYCTERLEPKAILRSLRELN